jgi:ech hydrogenase subunit A
MSSQDGVALDVVLFVPIIGLVLFPLLVAAALLVVRADAPRRALVIGAALLIGLSSIFLAVEIFRAGELRVVLGVDALDWLIFAVDILIAVYIIVKGIRHRRVLAIGLASLQLILVVIYEFVVAHGVTIYTELYLDGLTAIMVLVIGIIGSGICVYSLGYMRDFRAHAEGEKDRRPVFFALMFVFLGAMFLLVFANRLSWLLCAWEITTVCSFALIGYTRTEEATANAFRQIVMNLLGGLGFSLALLICGMYGIGELDLLVAFGANPSLLAVSMMFPIALLAFAGITKAAQVPFQSWLLGAMVAPTPTSALLHSSTMVKAGVFLLIRLAPALGWNANGMMVMLIGALTFLFCTLLAISQRNAKRVLAYSTIANLGLITACAGVGTPAAIWAAVFLLVFHAAAKSLLFLCVGTAEHHIGSRDIEGMDNLFVRMPILARLMAFGMLVMFIAPFGMLIAKWAVIVSLVETGNLILLIILAFGSAATFMVWAKWLGKVLAVAEKQPDLEKGVHRSEWVGITLMAALALLLSLAAPFISEYLVMPWLSTSVASFFLTEANAWIFVAPAVAFDNLLIMSLIVLVLVVLFFAFFGRSKKRQLPIYLAGVGLDSEKRSFRGSLGTPQLASQRNWYLGELFGEDVLTSPAVAMCTTLLVLGLVLPLLSLLGVPIPWEVIGL